MSITLDPLIAQKLRAFAQRRRTLIVVKGMLAGVAVLLLTMLAVAAVDLQWMLPEWLRWSLSGAAYLAVLIVAWRACLRQLLHAPDQRQLARLIEHAEPGLREDLLSAVELSRAEGEVFDSEQFRSLLQADVARRMGNVEVGALLPVKLIRRYIGWALAIGVTMVVMMAASGWRFHTLLLRALFPGANLERVSRTKVIVQEPEGGDRIVPQGDTVRVVVELAGEPANRARIETMGDQGGSQVMDMEPLSNNRFAATVQVSRASVRYRIKAGDALTRKYLLDARERPFVTEYQKTFHYPAYSELPDRKIADKEGALIALEGTEVELKLKTNQPVKRAELLIEQGKASSTVPLTAGADGLLAGKITLNASGSYRVHLTGAETGFENKFSPENELRAEPDLLPAVELETPKNDLILPANELVDIVGSASDDIGIAKISRLVRVNEGGWKEALLAERPGRHARVPDRWDLFQSGVKPGDLLTMKLAVTDLKGSRAESRPLQITITASGFEMRRIQELELLRALNESVRALAGQAAKLHSSVRKANEGTAAAGADKGAAAKQAGVAITGATTEFDAKFTESWTAFGAALREAKSGHASAELVMLGRSLAQIGFGSAKIARADAAAISLSPAARKAQSEALETAADMERRAKLAANLSEMITISEEVAVLLESGIILQREQKRLIEMASAAGNDASHWTSLAGRFRVAVSQAKSLEEILKPMAVRDGIAQERSRVVSQQLQHIREAFSNSLPQNNQPDRQMLLKLTMFSRGVEIHTRGFNDWNREFCLRPVFQMREMVSETGPVFALVMKLAESLDSIRKEGAMPPEVKSPLTEVRWKICTELFKTNGDLEEARRHADNQFVSDLRQGVAALESLHALASGADAAEICTKLDELDKVFRVLEGGHNLQETMDGFTQLAASERWELRDLSARTDAPRDWRWLEARMRMIPDELGKAKPARASDDLAKAFGGAQQILWKAQQITAWQGMEREMGGRGNCDYTPVTARQQSEELAGQVKLALDLLRKPMADARKELAKLSPTVSQLAAALAKEQTEVKKETEERAKKEQTKNPDDARAEAENQIAQQQQLNQKVETLKDLVRADANKQDILNQDQREKMRDADDALAMLKDPPPKAEQALQDAAAAAAAQQKADLERATEQQQKLADALTQIAEHFEKMEQGKPVDESRTALREKEKELGIKEQLDAQQAHAQMLAEMAQKDPAQLLKELEAKLPENPAMQKELGTIGNDTLADAGEKLANAATQESKIAQALTEQAKQEQAAEAAQGAQKVPDAAQQTGNKAGESAKAAEQSPADAKEAAQEAGTMAQANPQLAKAAEQQQPIAANAADAGGEVARAGRHEQRLGNQPAGEQLAQLGGQIAATAGKAVPEAQAALTNAKSAAAAAAPVNEAKAQLAAELSALNKQVGGQTAQPAPQGAQSDGQPAAQTAGQPPGQQATAASASPAEQQAMARALDSLDQQLNASAAQQAANGEGQQGQQGQQGKQGQPQQAQGDQPGKPGREGQQGQAQAASQSAMAQAAQAAAASMRMDRAQNSATQPGSLLGASQSEKSLGGAKAEGTAMNSKDLPSANGLNRGDWGRLPKKLAEQLTKGSQESIPGEYRQAVETYYRVIAEKTRKRP